jgi:hypothetical protein
MAENVLRNLFGVVMIYIGVMLIGTSLGQVFGWVIVFLYSLVTVITFSIQNGYIDSDPRTPMIY